MNRPGPTSEHFCGRRATAGKTMPCLTILMLMLAGLLTACSTSPVVPRAEFPHPVLNQIPVPMGLYMDNEFKSHVHVDKPPRGPEQKVSVGPASRVLFKEFLSAQFQPLLELQNAPDVQAAPQKLKAVLQPVIEEVQISSPRTEKDSFYEAWIKYRLHLTTLAGTSLTSWEIAAYGKHRSSGITGSNADLTAAVRDALRDAAAGMALIFRDGNTFQSRLEASLAKAGTAQPQPAKVSESAAGPVITTPASGENNKTRPDQEIKVKARQNAVEGIDKK